MSSGIKRPTTGSERQMKKGADPKVRSLFFVLVRRARGRTGACDASDLCRPRDGFPLHLSGL